MLFEKLFKELAEFHELILHRKAIISYSGGKDSTLLVLFYKYLTEKYSIPKPILFHLDHQIRNNQQQEIEIFSEAKSYFEIVQFKKKTFHSFRFA